MVDALFKLQVKNELGALLSQVEKVRGRQTLFECTVYRKAMKPPPSQGRTDLVSELPAACMMAPLAVSRWLSDRETVLPADIRHYLTLYAFVLATEVRYMYATAANLLGALLDASARPGMEMYDWTSAPKCFEKIECLHKALGDPFPLIATWKDVLDWKLRNTIGHSNFVLTPGVVLAVQGLLGQLTGGKPAPGRYKLEDVERRFVRAYSFLDGFFAAVTAHTTESTVEP